MAITMNQSRSVKVSKFLSYHLRHHPEELGLELEPGGWVNLEILLTAAQNYNFPLTLEELKEVVKNSEKQRFSFNSDQTKMRANQGHSVEVDLQLNPVIPPDILYHGTGKQLIEPILAQGLQKMTRHHVHLSADVETATKVGQRKGKPLILVINAQAMHEAGYQFYCADNGVWLVDSVPPEYLKIAGKN